MMTTAVVQNNDVSYDHFLRRMQERFDLMLKDGPLFTTDANDINPENPRPTLFELYLSAIPDEHRQYHNCHCCRHFINRFGGLVVINEHGLTSPAISSDLLSVPSELLNAMTMLLSRVAAAKITGVFYSSEKVWGQPVTGDWRHMAIVPPKAVVFNHPINTAFQASAEKSEDRKNVLRALAEFSPANIETAITLLETDSLYRSEKCLGQAQFLKQLHDAKASTKNRRISDNLIWRAIALAPAGFCHPRSSMIGSLLEDIAAGMTFDVVKQRFDKKMHPLQYQRPQAGPSNGQIESAEKIIAQLGVAASLARRYARLDEIQTLWIPKAKAEEIPSDGVFGHLKPKAEPANNIEIPAVSITWEKFQRTILADADKIEYYVVPRSDAYVALVTAVNSDAPPILQWDREEQRNPVSKYLYNGGSLPSQWGLSANMYCSVTALTGNPSSWFDSSMSHYEDVVIFIIDGCRDQIRLNSNKTGLCLFPEILKSEFHGIRSTIEAYSNSKQIDGHEESSACGILISKNHCNHTFRVTIGGKKQNYKIDRWD